MRLLFTYASSLIEGQMQVLSSSEYSEDKAIDAMDQRKRLGLDMGVRKSYQMENHDSPLIFIQSGRCMAATRPTGREVSRLLLELLRDLEEEHGGLIAEFVRSLNEGGLIKKGYGDSDTDSLMRSLVLDLGEPVGTLPKVVAIAWLMFTDMNIVEQWGWCPIEYVNKYVVVVKKGQLYKDMKRLEPILDRARFLMEEFIHSCTQGTMFDDSFKLKSTQPAHRRDYRVKDSLKRFLKTDMKHTSTTKADDVHEWYTDITSTEDNSNNALEDTDDEEPPEVTTTRTTTTTRRTTASTRTTTTSTRTTTTSTRTTTTSTRRTTTTMATPPILATIFIEAENSDENNLTDAIMISTSCSNTLGYRQFSYVSKVYGYLQWKMLSLTLWINSL